MIRLPAEWEKQSAVLIAWPHRSGDFSDRIEAVEDSYIIIAKTIAQFQKVLIICGDDEHELRVKDLLKLTRQLENIEYIRAAVNDIWVRDTAFLTVEDETNLVLVNFRFNGWGNKYPHHEDDALNHKMLAQKPFRNRSHFDVDFILEGGSIESDGAGTILTTRHCLLNDNRNSSLTENDIEQKLSHYLGAQRVLWLDQDNLSGDDTDAHIDTLARFCSPTTIAYTSCENQSDHHYQSLKNMAEQLKTFRTVTNTPYQLVDLPLPAPLFDEEGQQLPANYANFLIINEAVLVPEYDDPMDKIALEKLAVCFPDRTLFPIPCRPLVHQYGSLHCMTMQFPSKVLNT